METNPQNSKDLKDSILSRIENENVEPCSRFRLVCTYGMFSFASLLSVVIGAVAVAVTIFTSLNAGWEYYEMTHKNALTFIFNALPYIWLVILGLTVVFGYYNMRHTKKGYRHSLATVILMLVGTSLVGGTTLYALKVGSQVDWWAHELFPGQYRTAYSWQKDMWHEPANGRIFGVVATATADSFAVRDIKGELWTVNSMALKSFDLDRVIPKEEIRLVGIVSSEDNTVVGCMVLPGVKEMPPSVREVNERRSQFKDRINMQKNMAEMDEPNPERKIIYRTCHDLVYSIPGEFKLPRGNKASE